MASSSQPQVKILDVTQLPSYGELGTGSYTGASFTGSSSLRGLNLTCDLECPLSVTYVGEHAQFYLYENKNCERIMQEDGIRIYHSLHRNYDSIADLPTLGKRMMMNKCFPWSARGLRFEGENQYMRENNTWTFDVLSKDLESCSLAAACQC
ncbi:uncharacterized protein LOC110007929 [Amborella trichopoda]|uniref:uncharacterized protein LOC110007929 n=1 Tax=Amborella trichopoda TaxID=13333 RepID=UPI0009BED862|nr:uncharacterized protein LOC110007929 [Amborella trichopoda]|eukprot:XP_020527959.1 uncharacterized protein LOC110007929 [Amborella trichopoda]